MDQIAEKRRAVLASKLPMSSTKKRKVDSCSAENVLPAEHEFQNSKPAITRSTSSSSLKAVVASTNKSDQNQFQNKQNLQSSTNASKQLFTVGTKSQSSKPPVKSVKTMRSKSATPPPTTATTAPAAPVDTSQQVNSKKPKRAPWDTKGKLEDMQQDIEYLRRKIEDKENDNKQLVVQTTEEKMTLEQMHNQQISLLREEFKTERAKLTGSIEFLQLEKGDLASKLNQSKNEIADLNDQKEQLTKELRLVRKEMAVLQLTIKENKFELDTKTSTIDTLKTQVSCLESSLSKAENEIVSLEQEKRAHETERRKLHNTIQELKGNIRVFCRIRPILSLESKQQEDIFSYPDLDNKKIVLTRSAGLNESNMNESIKRSEKLEFSFDKIFQPCNTQSEVFEEISQLVQSALDGYNVCIFAYGQTGSGKTYTMQGPDHMDSVTEGMIPRSIQQIFDSAKQLSSLGWTYTMEASFLEIYNETIRDLLGNPGKEDKYEIKTASGEVVVTNLTIVQVTQPRQVENLFERATKNRHVAETQCNARSSRSHSVFTLKISGQNAITSESCLGTLNLVDLAGSERLKESKSEGDRLKETQCINASLSALGNVIMSLAAKKQHIPYRDSKLTFLLQNSLGGNSKTLMFVNVSPNEEHFSETVNSLRFATKVNNCTIGTARKVLKS